MANRLKVAKVLSVKQLHDQGWSQRRIARELGISRDAVARHLRKAGKSAAPISEEGASNKATSEKAPTGSQPSGGVPNKATWPTQAPTGSRAQLPDDSPDRITDTPTESRSQCQPFRKMILDKLEQGLSAQRIFQDLVDEHGFDGKYHSVRRFVAKLNQVNPLPFRRIEVAAGEDYGKWGAMFSSHAPTKKRLATGSSMRHELYIISSVMSFKSARSARLKLGGDHVQESVVERASYLVPAFGT